MDDFLDGVERRLREAFAPTDLQIVDESHLHAGHAGARGGARHLRVQMTAAAFAGQGLLARHRAVQRLLADDLRQRIHALALDLRAPGE